MFTLKQPGTILGKPIGVMAYW